MTASLRAAVLLALSLCCLAFPSSCQTLPSDQEIIAAIHALPSPPNDFQLFYRYPQRSTGLLIAELRPVRRGKYLSGQHPLSVWIIRALRSLTGLDFKATTSASLSVDEANFLGVDERHPHSSGRERVSFFGTWMSRDSVWVAPRDAQVAIIHQWQKWFAEHGRDFKYVNDRDADKWYF